MKTKSYEEHRALMRTLVEMPASAALDIAAHLAVEVEALQAEGANDIEITLAKMHRDLHILLAIFLHHLEISNILVKDVDWKDEEVPNG